MSTSESGPARCLALADLVRTYVLFLSDTKLNYGEGTFDPESHFGPCQGKSKLPNFVWPGWAVIYLGDVVILWI